MKKPIVLGYPCDTYDWIPLILRSVSGFNSCLTVAITSLLFMMTIHETVVISQLGWPHATKIAIMLSGTIVVAWHFVNVNATLSSVFKTMDTETQGETPEEDTALQYVYSEADVATERKLFGLSTVLMRAIAGWFAVHVICFISLLYVYTIRSAVLGGMPLPSNTSLMLAVIGPIVTSWNFVRAANTIATLVRGGGAILKFRAKLAEAIAPKQ